MFKAIVITLYGGVYNIRRSKIFDSKSTIHKGVVNATTLL